MAVAVAPRGLLGAGRASQALPDPGEAVPKLSWPTVVLCFMSIAVFSTVSWAAADHLLPAAVTIGANAAAIFMLFTVLHDAAHHSISSRRWVNAVFGRVAMLFQSPAMAFPAWAFIHIEHHRWANDDERDPDSWASHATWWQLPFRWASMEIPIVGFYMRNMKRRPLAERIETNTLMVLTVVLLVATVLTGTFSMLALIYLIPARISTFVLAWWFDWLPHHGLVDTERDNRYRATRTRVGMEWLFTPLMLSQNYHLVHHLHPSVPFHRYLATWRRNEDAYLQREAAIATVFGRQLDAEEFREWKKLNGKLLRVLPLRTPSRSGASHPVFYQVPVLSVGRLTDDSVAITFDMPEDLRDQFRFEAGQHLTVRTHLDGNEVRRNYSICSPATGGPLQIAVRHIPGGAFSTFAIERLQAGDRLELMTPTGQFGTRFDRAACRHYVAVAGGSGITPILSLLLTALEVESGSRFTLIYANRTAQSTMFNETIDGLQAQHPDRLQVIHVRESDPDHPPTPETPSTEGATLSGRIDPARIASWLEGMLAPAAVDEWFLCGPMQLVTLVRNTLLEHHVDPDRIHLELFHRYKQSANASGNYREAAVTIRLSDSEDTVELRPGETILEAALQVRDDAPYACMGGACGTCKAKLICGSVEMDQNFALGRPDIDAGYVLTCQSHPTSPTVTVDYDA